MASRPLSGMDMVTIGRRIKDRRLKFGYSIAELAEKAGVARYTLIRIEQGKPCNPATLNKVRKSLGFFTDQMTRPYADGPFAVHRTSETRWNVAMPKATYQKQIEEDDRIHVDEDSERRRLGLLGFQPFFTAILGSELSGGVSEQAMMELHRPSWVDKHHGEEFVFCLRGRVTITVEDANCTLEEGDAMSFDGTLPHQYAPAEELGPNEPAALILIVVSQRPGEGLPKKP